MLLLASIALSTCSVGGSTDGLTTGTGLDPPTSHQTWGLGGVGVGEPLYFGLWALHVNGRSPIHLKEMAVGGMPTAFVIDRIWAARPTETHAIVTARGEYGKSHLEPLLHPLSSVSLDPLCPNSSLCDLTDRNSLGHPAQDWYITVQAHLSKAGSFESSGVLRFTYDVARTHYQQTITGQTLAASTTPYKSTGS
jgi:hypothetical protein